MPAMVRVRRCAAGDLAQEVAGDDGVGVRSADAPRRLGRDAAGAHVADAAADAVVPNPHCAPLRVQPVADRDLMVRVGLRQDFERGLVPCPGGRGFFRSSFC